MVKLKAKLVRFILLTIMITQVGGGLLWGAVKTSAENKSEQKQIEHQNFDWSTVNFDDEVTLYADEEEYYRKVNELMNEGKRDEVKNLVKIKHKMSDEEALAAFNVPEEIRNFVRNYRDGKIDKENLNLLIRMYNSDKGIVANNKEEEKINIIDLDKQEKLNIKSVILQKKGENKIKIEKKDDIKKINIDKWYPREDLKKNLDKFIDSKKKVSFLQQVKNIIVPTAEASGVTKIIDYYEGIESNSVDNALYYLSLKQNEDGSFGSENKYENTFKVVDLLINFNLTESDQFNSALNYLVNTAATSTRENAYKLRILKALNLDYQSTLQEILNAKNSDSGYGFKRDYKTDFLTTIEVMEAEALVGENSFVNALAYILVRIPESGAIYYEGGQAPSYHLAARTLKALYPFDGCIISINGQEVNIHTKIQSILDFMSTNYDSETGLLTNTSDLFDYSAVLSSLRLYNTEKEKQALLFNKVSSSQNSDGSFQSDIYTTLWSADSLAQPDLVILDLNSYGSLINNSQAIFKLNMKNQGYAATTKIDLYSFIDDFKFSENIDLQNIGLVLDPGQSLELTYSYSAEDTVVMKGATNVKFYFESANDVSHDDNWKTGNFTFVADSSNSPALQVYYIAYKYSIDNLPGVNVRWPVKADSGRSMYIMGMREKGQSEWYYYGVDNTLNGAFFAGGPFLEGRVYEIATGVLYQDNQTILLSNDITDVQVSNDDSKYLGNVSGYVTQDNVRKEGLYLSGFGFSDTSRENGDVGFLNKENGASVLGVDRQPYEKIYTKFPIKVAQTTENVRFFTRLKEDTTPPVLNSVSIKWNTTYRVKNQQEIPLFSEGSDNVGVKEGDFYLWDPLSSSWVFIGTYAANNYNYVDTKWYLPANYLGTGYKLKGVLRDYRGNVSEAKEWGPFEIYDGTPPTGSVEVVGLVDNAWTLGETKKINWQINAQNPIHSIPYVKLYYGDAYKTIVSYPDKDLRTYDYSLPVNYSYVTDNAYVAVNVSDVNGNNATFVSPTFKIIDNSPDPIAPWAKVQAFDFDLSAENIQRNVLKIFDNVDGSKEVIYREQVGYYYGENGQYNRLYYRKFASGQWGNPVLIKEYYGETENIHNFMEMRGVKDSSGKIYLTYTDYISGGIEQFDFSEIYFVEIYNGQVNGVNQISFDNTYSSKSKVYANGGKVYILWSEGYSFTNNTGIDKLKYTEGIGLNTWSSTQILSPDGAYRDGFSMDFVNNIPVVIYDYYGQYFVRKNESGSWSSPIVLNRKDILKSKLDVYTEDKDKFHLIVEDDPNNSENYLWLDSVNTGTKLEQVLTANNFVRKNDIINTWWYNEFGSNTTEIYLFHKGNNNFDIFYEQPRQENSYRRNIYGLNFTLDLSKTNIVPDYREGLVELVSANDNITGQGMVRFSDGKYHLIYRRALEGSDGYYRMEHSLMDDTGIYYRALVSPLSFYSGEAVDFSVSASNKANLYYLGYSEGKEKIFYNQADFTVVKDYKVTPIEPLHNSTINTSSVNLKWNVLGGSVDSYNVYFGVDPYRLTQKASGLTVAEYTVSGLEPNKTYYWQVAAIKGDNVIYSYPWQLNTSEIQTYPEINLVIDSNDTASNGSYNFGSVKVNESKDLDIKIENKGEGKLVLPSNPISFDGVNKDEFSVLTNPALEINAGESSTFKIKFNPVTSGNKSAVLSMQNNDQDENPYVINVSGMGGSQMLEYKFNEGLGSGSFADTSGNNIMATCSGINCPTAEAVGKIDKALSFDGSSDYLNVPDSVTISPREQITIETLVNLQLNTNFASNVIVSKNFDYEITLQNNRNLRMGITNEAGVRVVAIFPVAMEYDKWNHVVMTYDGQKIRGYVNGKLVGEQEQTGLIRWSKVKATIGSLGNGFYIKGRMDEFNLYNYQLNEAEIKAKYRKLTNVFSYNFNEAPGSTSFVDESGNEINAVCSGVNCPTAQGEGKVDKAIIFDGIDDRMSIADNNMVNPKEEVTIEALVNLEKTTTFASQVLLSKNGDYEMTVVNNGGLRLGITNEAGTRVVWNIGGAVTFDKWNYLVMTYDGQKIRGYVNGRLVGEQAQSGYVRKSGGKDISIGSLGNGFWLKGKMDSLNMYNYKWSDDQIAVRYKEIFNDPNMAIYEFKESVGAKTFADSSYNGLNLSCSNCPTAGETGLLDQAVSFNGSGNVAQVADNAALNPKSVISIEALIFPEKNTVASSQVLVTKSLSYEMTIFNNRTLRVGIINESGQRVVLDIPSVINFSQWNYLALTYDGQTVRAYNNGQLVGEKAQIGNIKWAKSKPLYVGGYGNAFFFKGKVDDLRLYEKVLTPEEITAKYDGLPK